MPGRDRHDRLAIRGSRVLDRVKVVGRGEEGFADDRVLEDVEQVGGVSPHVLVRSARDLITELSPGGGAVSPGPIRIRRSEQNGNRFPNGVVDDQSIVAKLDERKRPETIE